MTATLRLYDEALEQTCRLRQISGSAGKYLSPASGVGQGHSTSRATTVVCTHR